ncbi:MAG: molybdenum cofactor guanylyltransferase [Opitutus sp.]|nr:molybdenum cofactor guanylyltransferase [Opitutus sp.]
MSLPPAIEMKPPFSAIVLAAGHSTRMGRDKALLEIEGGPLWQRQRDLLRDAGAAEIFLSARPEQPWTRATTGFAAVVHDSFPNSGPLAGLTAGLERASHSHLAVLAVDLPQMTAGWFNTLRAECTSGVGVVGWRGDFFEPLAAFYPREMMPLAWEALAHGENSLQRLLAAAVAQGLMRLHEITSVDVPLFENWNEPGNAGH